jgi:serine/threonine protein kinase
MEYCSGGDLFSYLEVRGFKLSEEKAAILIHKLSAAVFYLHSYGICHRDLKPENILMTDNTDTADIRLLDFGLSKIIGPGEVCTEPYGTLVISKIFILVLCCSRSSFRKALFKGS